MSVPTRMVSFVGGPLNGWAGEVMSLAPIGLDGGPMHGRGVYRHTETGLDGDAVFEWTPVIAGQSLIEPHLRAKLPVTDGGQEDIEHAPGARFSSLDGGRPAAPDARVSVEACAPAGGPSSSPPRSLIGFEEMVAAHDALTGVTDASEFREHLRRTGFDPDGLRDFCKAMAVRVVGDLLSAPSARVAAGLLSGMLTGAVQTGAVAARQELADLIGAPR